MRAVDVRGADRELLPAVCATCTWWQTDAATGAAQDRVDWERAVEAESGLVGRALLEGADVLGWMQVAPGALVARARRLPGGAPSSDAVLLTCAYFYDAEFLPGFQSLLQDVVATLKRRDAEALEAYGLLHPSPEDRFHGYLRDLNLFNGSVLEGNGFRRLRSSGAVARYRLELDTLIATPRRSHATEVQTGPVTQPV